MRYGIICKTYHGSHEETMEQKEVFQGEDEGFFLLNECCRAKLEWKYDAVGIEGNLHVDFLKDSEKPVAFGFQVIVESWKKENYVLIPAAAYDGNRMESIPYPYPPYHQVCKEDASEAAPVITDIPHLDFHNSRSALTFLSGDMSTPALGFYDEEMKKAFFLMGPHSTAERYTGFSVEEDLNEQKALLTLWAPGVREDTRYFFGERRDGSGFYPDSHALSKDTGQCFRRGESLKISFRMFHLQSENLLAFFRNFNRVRNCMEKGGSRMERIPFSAAYETIKAKYQRENYIEGENPSEGYYGVGTDRSILQQHWQAGWTGGGINFLPFLLEDRGEAMDRGIRSFRFILDHLMNGRGWVCGIYADGVYYGDSFEQMERGNILLLRKNADLLYFLMKELNVLEEKQRLRPGDREKPVLLADAFVRLYEKYGQIGQFIDIEREELLLGNTAGPGIVSAGLALAYEVYGKPEYLQTAESLAELYYRNHVVRGILNGGPGEICQASDSESAFGLVESYVQLYETTGDKKWLAYAEDTFEIAVTWVMSYDFHFPESSTAAQRDVHTHGTVFANVQNKHSAPGICTLSGNSLLKLYRFTGDEKYLDWLVRIAHSLPQFVSMEKSRIPTLEGCDLPVGYMNERVQTSDWEGEETVGEFLCGSNWPEVSMLLTYVEIPGVYVDFCNKTVRCFDHILCRSTFRNKTEVVLDLYNPTDYDARITILPDFRLEKNRITRNYYSMMEQRLIKAGGLEKLTISLWPNGFEISCR